MPEMGSYCKAYKLKILRQYPGWKENQFGEPKLDEEHIVYLQENFTVTDGIFLDERILFDSVTDDWARYCSETLQFIVPKFAET